LGVDGIGKVIRGNRSYRGYILHFKTGLLDLFIAKVQSHKHQ
jgi:hypothetical protein